MQRSRTIQAEAHDPHESPGRDSFHERGAPVPGSGERPSCPDSHPQRPLAHMITCMTSLQPNQNPIWERGKGSELE